MRRRPVSAVFAVLGIIALAGCQGVRAQSSGASRLSEPTMSSGSTVPSSGAVSDAPRYNYYDPL